MTAPGSGKEDESLPGSLRRLGGDALIALSQRIELAAVEVRIAQRRALIGAAAGMAAAYILLTGIISLTIAVVLQFFPEHMVAAMAIAGGVYFVVGGILGLFVLLEYRNRPLPMSALVDVLKEDMRWIIGHRQD